MPSTPSGTPDPDPVIASTLAWLERASLLVS
jgi:hypothetical protein